jgi:hypothetical protein
MSALDLRTHLDGLRHGGPGLVLPSGVVQYHGAATFCHWVRR